MQNLFHGDKAALVLIFQYVPQDEYTTFALCCQAFNAIASEFLHNKYKSVSFHGHKNIFLNRVIHSARYAQYLENVFFDACPMAVAPVLQKFAKQLKKIDIQNGVLEWKKYVPQGVEFPKVEHFGILVLVSEQVTVKECISFWIQKMPNLKYLEMNLRTMDGETRAELNQLVIELAPLVQHVAQVTLNLFSNDMGCAAAFGKQVVNLHAPINKSVDMEKVYACISLAHLELYMHSDTLQLPMGFNLSRFNLLKSFCMSHVVFGSAQEENEFFKALPSTLTELRVSCLELQTFPQIAHLSNLEILTLIPISASIPEWFYSFAKFTKLVVSKNGSIDLKLPDYLVHIEATEFKVNAISILPELESLTMHRCEFDNVSEALQTATKLREITLDSCNWDWDDDIDCLQGLKLLSMTDCYSLPDYCQLHNVEKLVLHLTELSSIPQEITKLPKLKILDLSHNDIRYITENQFDGSCDTFPALQELIIVSPEVHQYPSRIMLPHFTTMQLLPWIIFLEECDDTVETSYVDRKSWTQFALAHLQKARNTDSNCDQYETITDAFLAYAVKCRTNQMLLSVHIQYESVSISHHSFETQKLTDKYAVVSMLITTNDQQQPLHVQHATWCYAIESVFKHKSPPTFTIRAAANDE